MGITLDTLNQAFHSVAVGDGTNIINLDGSGNVNIVGTLTGITNDVNIADGGNSITIDGDIGTVTTVTSITNDVNIADGGNSITVDFTRLDYSTDNVEIKDAAGDALAINADGSINTTISATDLDIRDLSHTQDSVKIGDGTDFLAVAADGSIAITDNGGSLTVDGTVAATQSGSWDIGTVTTVTAVTDITNVVSVDDNGGSLTVDGTVAATQSGSWSIETTPGAYSDWQTKQVSVTNSATQLDATPLSGRISCIIQNLGSVDIYISDSNSVSTSNGLLVPKGASQEIALDDTATATIWGITASGTATVAFAEYKA